jgi:xanthine dehydrogenase accessory factor
MKKELELWQFVAERLKRKQSVMLLVVAESAGSSPGRQGFKMAVAEDEMCGSIGGGLMEVKLVEQAGEIIFNAEMPGSGDAETKVEDRRPKTEDRFSNSTIVEQVHRKNSPQTSGMICSGKQTVIFYKLSAPDLPAIRQIVEALENHQSKMLQISSSKFQIAENTRSDFDFGFEQTGENEFLYEEKLGSKNRLFIVGGGHCALALSELMAKMDFHISLFDDRPHLNTLAKNEFVHRKHIVESYERIGELIPSGASIYVVVMTLGYQSDETVIRRLLEKQFKYFGVLGSRAKMKTLLRNLEKENFPKEKLSQIHTPIGLPINSRTPEEIAVSIAAQIILVKNRKSKL